MEKRVLTAPEVAQQLGVHTLTVRRAIARGELRAVRIGSRVLIPAQAFEDFLATRAPAAAR